MTAINSIEDCARLRGEFDINPNTSGEVSVMTPGELIRSLKTAMGNSQQLSFYSSVKDPREVSPGLEREISALRFDADKKTIALYNGLRSIPEGEHEVPVLTSAEISSLQFTVMSNYEGSSQAEILSSIPGSGRITGRYAFNDEKNGLVAFVDPDKSGSGHGRVMTLHKTSGYDNHFDILNSVANKVTENYFERFKDYSTSFNAMAEANREAQFFKDNLASPS